MTAVVNKMAGKLLQVCLISVSVCIGANGQTAVLATIGSGVFNVVKFAWEVVENINNDNMDTDKLEKITDLLSEVNERLHSVSTEIITTVLLQSKLDRIDDAVINVKSSLVDLENLLKAKNNEDRKEYIKLFISRFEEHGVIKHTRFLAELLHYTVPGSHRPLLELYTEQTRCNMSAMYEFEKFYYHLISNGIALEVTHQMLTSNLSVVSVFEWWGKKLDPLEQIIEEREAACKAKFITLAEEDVKLAADAKLLWKSNNQRYPWLRNNVFFLKPFGTHQFLFMIYKEDSLFHHKSHVYNKIVIFTHNEEGTEEKADIRLNTDTLKAGMWTNSHAAKEIGLAVEFQLVQQGLDVKAILVYFEDKGEFSTVSTVFDEKSNLIKAEIDDLQYEYCHETGAQCTLDILNLFKGKKSVKGKMNIIAYVVKQPPVIDDQDERRHEGHLVTHKTSGASWPKGKTGTYKTSGSVRPKGKTGTYKTSGSSRDIPLTLFPFVALAHVFFSK